MASTFNPAPDAPVDGTRTASGGTYGDFVRRAPAGLGDPSRGAELERDAMPPDADFARRPTEPDPAEVSREERIRAAAFRKYQQRNGAPGDPMADWLAAEAEIDDAAASPLPRSGG